MAMMIGHSRGVLVVGFGGSSDGSRVSHAFVVGSPVGARRVAELFCEWPAVTRNAASDIGNGDVLLDSPSVREAAIAS